MEVNTLPNAQNNTAAAATAAAQQPQRQDNNAKQVNPTKESADTGFDIRQTFDQDRIIRDALNKNVIKDETQLFNFRVTRYENELTFTNVGTGEITTVDMHDVVGSNAIDAAI